MPRYHHASPLLVALWACCGCEALKLRPSQHADQRSITPQLPISIRRIGRGGAGAGGDDLAEVADSIEESIAFVNISVDQAKDIVANDAVDTSSGGASGESTQAPAGEATTGVHSKVKDAMTFMKSAPIEKLKQIKDTVSIDALKAKTSAITAKALVLNTILLFGSPSRPLTPLSVITLSLLGSSLGFHSYLWFATVGYTVSLGLISLAALICYNALPSSTQIPKLSNLQAFMVLIWSIRLTAFLLYREYVAWPSLHAKTKRVDEESHEETKLGVWLTCGAFYAAQSSPFCYRLQAAVDGVKSNWGLVGKFGIFAQFVGLLFESIADAQKATFKAEGNRNNWCNIGLWKHFSHPNYLGETIFWLGVYLGGIGCYTASYQYVISTIGFVFIASVLKSATDTLSAQELRRYGMNEDYLEFRRMRGFLGPIKLRRQPEKQILL